MGMGGYNGGNGILRQAQVQRPVAQPATPSLAGQLPAWQQQTAQPARTGFQQPSLYMPSAMGGQQPQGFGNAFAPASSVQQPQAMQRPAQQPQQASGWQAPQLQFSQNSPWMGFLRSFFGGGGW